MPSYMYVLNNNSVAVVAEKSPNSDSLDFVEAEFHESEGLEMKFNSGFVPSFVPHLAVEIGSVTLDALYDPGSTRTFVRNRVGQRILDSTGKELDRSHRSMMIVAQWQIKKANGSMQAIDVLYTRSRAPFCKATIPSGVS